MKAKAYKVDVADYEAIQKLKDDITADFPGQSVDILINNAGILSKISLAEGTYQQVQKVIDVNLTAHFWVRNTQSLIAKSNLCSLKQSSFTIGRQQGRS